MKLGKSKVSTEVVKRPRNDGLLPVANRDQVAVDCQIVDQDVARSWELKAGLQWARNDGGPLNRFRWFLCDRYGIGRPPSRVEKRPRSDELKAVTSDPASSAGTLRFVALHGGSSCEIGLIDQPTPSGFIDHP